MITIVLGSQGDETFFRFSYGRRNRANIPSTCPLLVPRPRQSKTVTFVLFCHPVTINLGQVMEQQKGPCYHFSGRPSKVKPSDSCGNASHVPLYWRSQWGGVGTEYIDSPCRFYRSELHFRPRSFFSFFLPVRPPFALAFAFYFLPGGPAGVPSPLSSLPPQVGVIFHRGLRPVHSQAVRTTRLEIRRYKS